MSKGLVPPGPLRSGPPLRSGREGRSRAEPNSCRGLNGRSGRRDSERDSERFSRGREKNSRSVEAGWRAGTPSTGRGGRRSSLSGRLGPRALSKGLAPVDPVRPAALRPLELLALSNGLVPLGPRRSGPPLRSGREGRSRAEPNFGRASNGRSGRFESGRRESGRDDSGRCWRGREANSRPSEPGRRAGNPVTGRDGLSSDDRGFCSGPEALGALGR